jgi:hypothetical protein
MTVPSIWNSEPLTGMKSLATRFRGKTSPEDQITLSPKVRRRARQLLDLDVPSVVDQTLNSIWVRFSAHRRGSPHLDDAILSTEVLLALLVEIKRREE